MVARPVPPDQTGQMGLIPHSEVTLPPKQGRAVLKALPARVGLVVRGDQVTSPQGGHLDPLGQLELTVTTRWNPTAARAAVEAATPGEAAQEDQLRFTVEVRQAPEPAGLVVGVEAFEASVEQVEMEPGQTTARLVGQTPAQEVEVEDRTPAALEAQAEMVDLVIVSSNGLDKEDFMKKWMVVLSCFVIITSCITTQPPGTLPITKPEGNPPLPFEGPLPSCMDEYLAWMKSTNISWFEWLSVNPDDIPVQYHVPCGAISPSQPPVPVTPTPIPPEKPWWDYEHITPVHVAGYGSPSDPVPLVNYIGVMGGYGFHKYYGIEYTVPKGKIVSFKADPFRTVLGYNLKTIRLNVINYESYRTNVYQAVIYEVERETGKETLLKTISAGSNFQVSTTLDYRQTHWFRIELYENGLGDTPMSIWWNP